MKNIKYIFADIDGVLTDGKVEIDSEGRERKNICYRDLDAIGVGHRAGLKFVFVTSEDTDLARFIAKRFNVDDAVFAAKDKGKAFEELAQKYNLSPDEICYIGDGERDVSAIQKAGLGFCPADAVNGAKESADVVLNSKGGEGVLSELVEKIVK